jgi:hypothetical protein
MKLCIDCRHAQPPVDRVEWMCGHPTAGVWRSTDVVTGRQDVVPLTCRANRQIANCKSGAYWEAKDEASPPLPGFT